MKKNVSPFINISIVEQALVGSVSSASNAVRFNLILHYEKKNYRSKSSILNATNIELSWHL